MAVQLFEKVAGRDGDRAKRLIGTLRSPSVEFLARLRKILRVELMESCRELRHRCKSGGLAVVRRARGADGSREQ